MIARKRKIIVIDQQRRETAVYLLDMAAAMSGIAQNAELSTLDYLFQMAVAEARSVACTLPPLL
jgi:hypothetical protein